MYLQSRVKKFSRKICEHSMNNVLKSKANHTKSNQTKLNISYSKTKQCSKSSATIIPRQNNVVKVV